MDVILVSFRIISRKFDLITCLSWLIWCQILCLEYISPSWSMQISEEYKTTDVTCVYSENVIDLRK